MTGYGEAHHAVEGVSYSVEIRSLNHRYFKATLKLTENLQYLEAEVEKQLRTQLQRGSVIFLLRVRNKSATAAYDINQAALQHYLGQFDAHDLGPGLSAVVDIGTILSLPGVCQSPELDEQARERDAAIVKRLTAEALSRLMDMRRREGDALRRDLIGHCDRLRELVGLIADHAPSVVQEYQRKLRDRVAMLVNDAELEVDKDSLIREVAVYADRCDISEELARLSAHVDQFVELCDSRDSAGRTLDFVAQEMLREANTIGSKSNDASIARNVVQIKGLIDRLKEQVQNVE